MFQASLAIVHCLLISTLCSAESSLDAFTHISRNLADFWAGGVDMRVVLAHIHRHMPPSDATEISVFIDVGAGVSYDAEGPSGWKASWSLNVLRLWGCGSDVTMFCLEPQSGMRRKTASLYRSMLEGSDRCIRWGGDAISDHEGDMQLWGKLDTATLQPLGLNIRTKMEAHLK